MYFLWFCCFNFVFFGNSLKTLKSLEYFNDTDIIGQPWWDDYKTRLAELDKDINKLKQIAKNINEESDYRNPKTQMQKRNEILMNNNELLKQCYIKGKDYYFRLYNGIINCIFWGSYNLYFIV